VADEDSIGRDPGILNGGEPHVLIQYIIDETACSAIVRAMGMRREIL
jgi:hypothetical protein